MTRLRIGIFGAASDNISKERKQQSWIVGQAIGQAGHLLIYGAGGTGCMGYCVRGYLKTEPPIRPFGSTTKFIEQIEQPVKNINLIVSTSLAAREELYYLSDILVVLPGGTGTLREFWGFLTEKRLQQWDGEIWVIETGSLSDILKDQLALLELSGCAKDITKDVRFLDIETFKKEMTKSAVKYKKPDWI